MIRPSELPAARDSFKDYFRTWGKKYLSGLEDHTGASGMADLELPINAALAQADLYSISVEMESLAVQAGGTLNANWAISPEDVPSREGLALFAEPFFLYRAAGMNHPIVGALWFYIGDRLMVAWLCDRFDPQFRSVGASGAEITPHLVKARGGCRLMFSGFQAMTYDGVNRPLKSINEYKAADSNGDDLMDQFAVLKSAWLLMGQQLACVETEKIGRPNRGKGGRTSKRPEVRVVRLRRVASMAAGESGSRDWQHRWLVRGHWRMQPWGPKRERVRPVWIAPHVKGPEGKPMLGGEKVYHLAR